MDVVPFISKELQILTILALYSYIFVGENIIFRIFTDLIMGYAVANTFVFTVKMTMQLGIEPLGEKPLLIIPLILGVMLYLSLSPRYRSVSRIPLAITFGITSGVMFGRSSAAWLSYMLEAAKITSLNSLIAFIVTISVIMYFIFHAPISKTEGEITSKLRDWGRLVLMACLGGFLGLNVVTTIEKHFLVSEMIIDWIKSGFGLLWQ